MYPYVSSNIIILDGNSEIGVHTCRVKSVACNFILYACASCSELPSKISNMIPTDVENQIFTAGQGWKNPGFSEEKKPTWLFGFGGIFI